MSSIFVSHAQEDESSVNYMTFYLSQAFTGVEFFVSSSYRSITPGSIWLKQILDHLINSCVVLVCLSRNSIKKPWVLFEAGGGFCNGRTVIPLILDDLPFTAIEPPDWIWVGNDIPEMLQRSNTMGNIYQLEVVFTMVFVTHRMIL